MIFFSAKVLKLVNDTSSIFLNLDLKYSLTNISYVLLKVFSVRCRTANVGLILYKNGLFSYLLIPKLVSLGTVWSFEYLRNLKIGDYLKLLYIPEGYSIYNIEIKLGYGGQIARAAGTSVKIINRYPNKYNKILLKFRSGEEYFVNVNCGATIGVSSNSDHWLKKFNKAGNRRLFGYRPHVRGVAMNPIDHPHGGNTQGENLV